MHGGLTLEGWTNTSQLSHTIQSFRPPPIRHSASHFHRYRNRHAGLCSPCSNLLAPKRLLALTAVFMLAMPPLFSRPHCRRATPSSRWLRPLVDRPPAQASSSTAILEPHLPDSRRARGYEDVLDCVLKVFCTHCEPNYELPEAMTPQRQSTSSAFVIQVRRIRTNAHSFEHYTLVVVKNATVTKLPLQILSPSALS